MNNNEIKKKNNVHHNIKKRPHMKYAIGKTGRKITFVYLFRYAVCILKSLPNEHKLLYYP